MPRMTKNNEYISSGVVMSPSVPSAGSEVKILYDGVLSKSGAVHLYAHIGFGQEWKNTTDYQMAKTPMGFEVNIPISKADTLNLCFRDCANHWDNNSGKNYSFDISH